MGRLKEILLSIGAAGAIGAARFIGFAEPPTNHGGGLN